MSEARDKALVVLGDVVLDANLVTLAVGGTVYLDDNRSFSIGEDAVRKLREWLGGGAEETADEETAGVASKPRTRRTVTEAEVDEWVDLWCRGWAPADIARKVGRSYATVTRAIRKRDQAAAAEVRDAIGGTSEGVEGKGGEEAI